MNDTAKALIMTVGLPGDQGGDVLDALLLDLEVLKPECLALLASSQSMNNARRMLERSGLPADRTELIELSSAHDLDEIFRSVNAVIQRLVARGYSPRQMAINYTSGTKVMGSGAVLAAVYNKVLELRYITGLGIVREGGTKRNRILTTQPGSVFAYQGLLAGRNNILGFRFRSAREELENLEDHLFSEDERALRRALALLAQAYGAWDNFQPGVFLEIYERLEFGQKLLRAFELRAGQVAAVRALSEELQTGQPGSHIIIDLINNAERRLGIGAIEDAMARLYRALEMMAQVVLMREYELDTNDLDTRRIPPRDRVGYEALRSLEDGVVKIGLRKAYELLAILRHPIGEAFASDPVMRLFLGKRADTILAHGLQPEAMDDALQYMEHTRQIFRLQIPQFDELSHLLQFPWIEGGEDTVHD